jgi:hypothetical protein
MVSLYGSKAGGRLDSDKQQRDEAGTDHEQAEGEREQEPDQDVHRR